MRRTGCGHATGAPCSIRSPPWASTPVRSPFSNEALVPGRMPQDINYDINPDLAGKTSLELMDVLMQGAADRGLKVILDRHRPDSNAQSELWYTDAVPRTAGSRTG